jgi:hypothetical protein
VADPFRHRRRRKVPCHDGPSGRRGGDGAADDRRPGGLPSPARAVRGALGRVRRDTAHRALSAALFAGRLATGGDVREVAQAARALPPAPPPARAADVLLDGLALLIIEGCAAVISAR